MPLDIGHEYFARANEVGKRKTVHAFRFPEVLTRLHYFADEQPQRCRSEHRLNVAREISRIVIQVTKHFFNLLLQEHEEITAT